MIAVVPDPGDHGLHRLLAELLRAMLRPLVQELAGIGRLAARRRAGIDNVDQVLKRKTRHHFELDFKLTRTGRGANHASRCSTSVIKSRQGSSRIGRPGRAMWSFASRLGNLPKGKMEAPRPQGAGSP